MNAVFDWLESKWEWFFWHEELQQKPFGYSQMILHLCVHERPRHQCTKQYMYYLSIIKKKNEIQIWDVTMAKKIIIIFSPL